MIRWVNDIIYTNIFFLLCTLFFSSTTESYVWGCKRISLSFVLAISCLEVTLALKPGSLVVIDPTHANTKKNEV